MSVGRALVATTELLMVEAGVELSNWLFIFSLNSRFRLSAIRALRTEILDLVAALTSEALETQTSLGEATRFHPTPGTP